VFVLGLVFAAVVTSLIDEVIMQLVAAIVWRLSKCCRFHRRFPVPATGV
jgi:large-conductance mechanosensitive channel